MAQRTTCPACGAPLEYSSEHDVVHCSFCESDIEVIEENGETRFRVLGRTEPPSSEVETNNLFNPDLGPSSREPGDPVAPGYASSATSQADPGDLFQEAFTPAAPPVPAETIPDVPAYYNLDQGAPAVPTSQGNRNRSIGIAIGVFLVACISCACLGAIAISTGGFRFGF